MKKKVIVGFIIFLLIFLLGGAYIIFTIEKSTTKLNELITLHQVEILREHLLIQIKRVQTDLSLHNTRHARGVDTVVFHVQNMTDIANTCFECHHSPDVTKVLIHLKTVTETYKNALSRVFTIRANERRLQSEDERAFKLGAGLINEVNKIIDHAKFRLDQRTATALNEIEKTKKLLYILVATGPLLALILAFMMIRGFMKPVNLLLEATRRLKKGDLDHRITGLKDEFGEVGASFNKMAGSLKEHMRKMLDTEKRYRMLFESAGDAIFILDAEGENAGKIVSANQAAADIHGYAMDELLKLNIKDLDSPEDAQKSLERIRHILEGKMLHEEMTHCKKDGGLFPVEVIAGLLEFEKHKYVFAYDRDITERKRAEEAFQEQLHFQQLLIDSIPVPVFYKDIQGRFLGCNKSFEELIGLTIKEIVGKTVYDISPKELADIYHEKDLELINHPGRQVYESNVKDSAGEIHDVIFYKAAFRRPDDSLGGLIGAILDITDRKRAEEAMQRTEQMVACGELSTRLAHEIKNPLAGIKLAMEVLSEDSTVSGEDRSVLQKVNDEVNRIETLLKSLLNFSRPPKPQLAVVDVCQVLENSFPFIEQQSSVLSRRSKSIEIVKDFQDSVPEIMADPMQLQQIFLNLYLNAIDAMPNGGILSVRASYQPSEHTVKVEISDTGEGVTEEMMNNLFKPFFTTKPKGTGLGLTITRQLVEQNDGTIEVSNKPEGGALFKIRFPIETQRKETQTT